MAQMRILYVVNLTYFFQSQTFQTLISPKCWQLAKMRIVTSLEVDIRHRKHHCECCTPRPWPIFSRYTIWNANNSEMVKAIAEFWNNFYILPSSDTIADVVLHHFQLHFQGQTFLCYSFAIEVVQWRWMSPQELARLVRPSSLSCACFQYWLPSEFVAYPRSKATWTANIALRTVNH